jgi:MFS family permease
MMLPASLAILGASFDGEARARAVGIWAAASAIGAAVGPALGGWLIDTVGWRAIFLINLPLGVAAVALALASVASHHQNRGRPLDFVGAFFATIGLGGVAAGLTLATGPNGFDGLALSFVCSGLASGTAFILTEIRKGEAAMTPTALIASRELFGLNLLTVLVYGALTGFLVMLPFVLIETGHQSATSAGAILLPFPLVMLIAGPAMGKLETRFGTKLLLTCGPLTVAAGFVAALSIDPHDSWTASLPCVLLVAAGMAATAASLTNAILSRVDEGYIGSASGLNSALARGAGLIATALLGHVLSARGDVLLTRFHAAVLVCAGVSLVASACAIWTLKTE